MKKAFLSTLILQLSLNLIVKPLYVFGIDRGVQNAIGIASFGIYSSLLSFSYLLHTLNDFGIQNFTSSNVAKHPHLVQKYFPNLFVFKLILSTIYMVLTLVGALMVGYSSNEIVLLSALMLMQIASSFLLFFRANIVALGSFYTDSFFSIFDRILLLFVGFVLLHFGFFHYGDSALLFVMIQAGAIGIAGIFAFFALKKNIGIVNIKFNPIFLISLLKKGIPYALIVFLMLVYTRTDVVLIERLLPNGSVEAGIYAAAYRLLEAVNAVMLIFGTLLLPIFAKMIGKKESIKEMLQMSIKLVLAISVTACLIVVLYRNNISTLLYKEATPYWADTMAILFLSYIPLSMMYVLGSLVTASGQLRQYNILNISIVIFSLTANLIIIPQYKAIGAAYVSVATQSLVIVGLFYINFKTFALRWDWKNIAVMSLFVAVLWSVSQWIQQTTLLWYYQIAIICIFAGFGTLLLFFNKIKHQTDNF